MMHRKTTITLLLATLLVSCAKQEAPTTAPTPPAATANSTVPDDPNVTQGKLNAGGVSASYAAHFDSERLERIVEERRAQDGATFTGEYTYQGARLLHYRGAKPAAPATLDLEFDMQGALRSGQGPDVTDEDVSTIRNRAQLLRSHALAQRNSSGHGSY